MQRSFKLFSYIFFGLGTPLGVGVITLGGIAFQGL